MEGGMGKILPYSSSVARAPGMSQGKQCRTIMSRILPSRRMCAGEQGRYLHLLTSSTPYIHTYLITLLSMYLQLGAVTPTNLGVATKESQLISSG